MENRINAELAAEVKQQILTKLREVRALMPFLVDLSPAERRGVPKMGNDRRSFVEESLVLAQQDDSYLPRSFEVADMERDWNLDGSLMPIEMEITQLAEMVSDTRILVGAELYTSALVVYSSAKRNGRGASLDRFVDMLGRRFVQKSKDEDDNDDGENNPPPNP
jgi:hypothetical protein